MEAASARMAARERYGAWAEPATTPLQRFIMQACDPQNFEPNLALNLEIVDMINAKKGNAPREAAIGTVNYINSRNPNVSMLALNLLDVCVKNCGYPFHLQVSTKEFLNELVRRFPERPPVHSSRPQLKILELIEEWRTTICQSSRYKEDLGFIRDMHRLLSYKGYSFPQVKRDDIAVLQPSDNLRSADEMEQEERAAQSAKLQELIRRGTPKDLQEANRLMKVMAGYDTRNKTDWRAKAAEEVSRVQQKAKLLEDMLQDQKPGDQLKEGDVFEELANALASAHPKIQRMCEEESEDHEAVAKLLEINDSIHRTTERYKLIKKGDFQGAANIPVGTLGTSGAGVSRGANNELSLIDFGGPEDSAPAVPSATNGSAKPSAGNALEDDLLGLSMGDSFGQGGALSLGPSNGSAVPSGSSHRQQLSNSQITNMFGLGSQATPPPPSQPSQYAPPSSLLGDFGSPAPQSPPRQQQQQQAPSRGVDPFASIAGLNPRSGSPNPATLPSRSTNMQASTGSLSASVSSLAKSQPVAAPAADDDEWTFSSALPETPSREITVTQGAMVIQWTVSRPTSTPHLVEIKSRVSSNVDQPITDITFQVAVTKSYSLQLNPQSSRSLSPRQQNGVTQTIIINGVANGQGPSVRMRWKAAYTLGGVVKEESGEVSGLGIP